MVLRFHRVLGFVALFPVFPCFLAVLLPGPLSLHTRTASPELALFLAFFPLITLTCVSPNHSTCTSSLFVFELSHLFFPPDPALSPQSFSVLAAVIASSMCSVRLYKISSIDLPPACRLLHLGPPYLLHCDKKKLLNIVNIICKNISVC